MVPGNPGDEEETETAAKANTVAAATIVAVALEVVFRLIVFPILVGFYCKIVLQLGFFRVPLIYYLGSDVTRHLDKLNNEVRIDVKYGMFENNERSIF